jgi:hypothetical protein
MIFFMNHHSALVAIRLCRIARAPWPGDSMPRFRHLLVTGIVPLGRMTARATPSQGRRSELSLESAPSGITPVVSGSKWNVASRYVRISEARARERKYC